MSPRILYVGMRHDYGRPEQGLSFEHCNFYDSLVHMGCDVIYFDFVALTARHGREGMNRLLGEVARSEKPDLLFCVLFADEFERGAVRAISDSGICPTVNWFCDDQRRFEDYSRHWAPCFNWVVTTAASAPEKYARMGYANAIKSQWAANPFLYRKLDLPLAHEVTFVGMPHGDRRQVIAGLRAAGVDVKAWGQGWESGRLSQEEMIRVFNQSRINLNLSNSAVAVLSARKRAKRALRRAIDGALSVLPLGERIGSVGRKVLRSMRGGGAAAGAAQTGAGSGRTFIEQIKGRNFEVPGCGGFMLTGRAEDLEKFYTPGVEIVCFDGQEDLREKIGYYLSHEDERAKIALAGYERTMREHTYVHRFTDVFRRMGVPCESAEHILKGPVNPGKTLDIS